MQQRRNLTSTVFKIYAALVASAGCFVIPQIVGDRSMVQLCRRTISLIQIGANGEVQPLETG